VGNRRNWTRNDLAKAVQKMHQRVAEINIEAERKKVKERCSFLKKMDSSGDKRKWLWRPAAKEKEKWLWRSAAKEKDRERREKRCPRQRIRIGKQLEK